MLDSSFQPVDDVFIGITQYEDIDSFKEILKTVSEMPEFADLLDTFEMQCFHVARVGSFFLEQ